MAVPEADKLGFKARGKSLVLAFLSCVKRVCDYPDKLVSLLPTVVTAFVRRKNDGVILAVAGGEEAFRRAMISID
ncbi:hypothetical protein XFF6992_240187 [Xanthomonas citri pv. fuscans]|uniref:hypothetical protein n=1 Tax=Xanthomonas citri TaxID=346 RepID=UPI000C5E7A42|nr:hypothetical protein [Xanthomonas citri]QTF19393.1 hypothetical protein XcfCFBP6992P_23640 [Xanthomonas citri pv. phaseoli var. fuscans]SOO18665.1 hypothetical protein XFF6992_240187 [Xanthomonas citri pv. fuscans]